MDIKQRVLNFIRNRHLLPAGGRVVIGVSGGPDSVVLTHILNQLRHVLSIDLCLAHYNHQIRPNSNRDQKFVENFAVGLNIPLVIGRRPGKQAKKKLSEDQARKLRFEFLSEVTKQRKTFLLILGHTQDDLAETVLMRLIRGSGIYGLRGILPQSRVLGMDVIRPLSSITRAEIEEYARRNKLKYCIDETNEQTLYLRNKIRHKLLPHLAKEFNPKISDALVDLADTASADYDFLQKAAHQRIKKNVVSSARTVRMKVSFLKHEHPAMKRLLLRHAYEHLTGELKQLTFAHIIKAQELIAGDAVGTILFWPKNVRLTLTKTFVILSL